jgi:hypothetical protein
MVWLDVLAAVEVGGCARDFQNAVVRAGQQSLPLHCSFKQFFALGVEGSECADLFWRNCRV